jgi:hypothetical protein
MTIGNADAVGADGLSRALAAQLTHPQADWLACAIAEVAADPAALATRSAAAGRRCGRALLGPAREPAPTTPAQTGPPPEALVWTVDDAVRALLLHALPLRGAALAAGAADLYHRGDAAERRGVLRALAVLDLGDRAVPVAADAVRTNDPRLLTAALGPYGAEHLDAHAYRYAVLKCVSTGVPLTAVAGLDRRGDAELARMLRAHADEQAAAGRALPAELRAQLRAVTGRCGGASTGTRPPAADAPAAAAPAAPPLQEA